MMRSLHATPGRDTQTQTHSRQAPGSAAKGMPVSHTRDQDMQVQVASGHTCPRFAIASEGVYFDSPPKV